MGGRAIALGGAFCALADDSSAVYYNPAGLADVDYSSLQVSTGLYGIERGTIGKNTGIPAPGVPNLNTAFTDLVVIPASAGFANTFGGKDELGRAMQGFGATIVIPSYRSLSPGSGGTSSDAQTTYKHTVTDREIWFGAGYGRRLLPRLRVGVSAFYVLRSVSDSEQLSYVANQTSQSQFETITSDVTLANGALLMIAGGKFDLDTRWSVGAAIRSPSVQLHSEGSIQYIRATSDPSSGLSSVDSVLINKLKSETKQSPNLRVGIARQVPSLYTLSLDVTAYAPTSYTLAKVSAETAARLPFATTIDRKAVVNVNLGGEYIWWTWFVLAGGVYTDFSSAHTIPQQPTSDRPPRVNLYGTTLSLGYIGEHIVTRFGALYSFGSGKDVRPVSDLSRLGDGAQNFTAQEFTQSFFYFYLSSTYRF